MITDEDVRRALDSAETLHKDLAIRFLHPIEQIESLRLLIDIVDQVMKMHNGLHDASPPDKLMEHMTEPELSAHLSRQLKFIKGCQSEDTVGSMLIIFQKDMICQYGATVDPEQAPKALRELADRIERRETVKRDTSLHAGAEEMVKRNRERKDNDNW